MKQAKKHCQPYYQYMPLFSRQKYRIEKIVHRPICSRENIQFSLLMPPPIYGLRPLTLFALAMTLTQTQDFKTVEK